MFLLTEKWYITQQTLPALLNRNALRFGTRRAQWWKDGPGSTASLNYAELWLLVKEAAAGLMELGLEKGDRAAVMAYTSPQWVWADYAIICAAGVSVSIYPTLSAKEVLYMVNDSGAKFLFVHDELILNRISEVRPQMTSLKKIILLNGSNTQGRPDVSHLRCKPVVSKNQLGKSNFYLSRSRYGDIGDVANAFVSPNWHMFPYPGDLETLPP